MRCAGSPAAGKERAKQPLHMPALSEPELSRHYTELAHKTRGVNDGFYPLGSCTMKYNPRVKTDRSIRRL